MSAESTDPATPRSFILLTRRGCHLCEDMLDQLEQVCRGWQVGIEMLDISADPVLTERFGTRIPVLQWGGSTICEGRLDVAAVQRIGRQLSTQRAPVG